MGMTDKVSGEYDGGRAWWRICGTSGTDKEVEEMQDDNIRYVQQQRWKNGLEGRKQTGKILTGNNYQPEGVFSLRQLRRGGNNGPSWKFGMHLETVCLIL